MLNFNEQLTEFTLTLLWSLWTEIGVAGIHRHHKDCLIDPEVLLLVTGFLGESDPRLEDEVRDWCNSQSYLISLQRIQGLARTFQVEEIAKKLATIEEWLGKSSRRIPEDLRKFSEKSKLPPLSQPSLLMLRMATIFGVGSRTVSLVALLTKLGSEVSVADVTTVAGFSKTNTANTLATLHLGGLLHKVEVRNRLQYCLAHPKQLVALIAPLPRNMTGWLFIFSFIVLWTCYAKQNTSSSPLRRAVAAVQLMKATFSQLATAGWEPPVIEGNPAQDLERIELWVLKHVEKIANGSSPQLKASFLLPPLLIEKTRGSK
ncbi:MAG: hypothetical protein H7Y37_03115 [Anaerolineae bacterium]|nr:hypothetical protein [Gloeobacterales cyanobacterium ES-bin-313]